MREINYHWKIVVKHNGAETPLTTVHSRSEEEFKNIFDCWEDVLLNHLHPAENGPFHWFYYLDGTPTLRYDKSVYVYIWRDGGKQLKLNHTLEIQRYIRTRLRRKQLEDELGIDTPSLRELIRMKEFYIDEFIPRFKNVFLWSH